MAGTTGKKALMVVYGAICLVLNFVGVLDGPYFFLKVHEQPPATIVLLFVIITLLCVGLALAYYKVKWWKA